MIKFSKYAAIVLLFKASATFAGPTEMILDSYRVQAKTASAAFTDFSAERGRIFFSRQHPLRVARSAAQPVIRAIPAKLAEHGPIKISNPWRQWRIQSGLPTKQKSRNGSRETATMSWGGRVQQSKKAILLLTFSV